MVAVIKLWAIGFVTWVVAMVVGMILGIPLRLFLPEKIAMTASLVIGLLGGFALLKDSWIDLGEDVGLVKKKVKPIESAPRVADGKEQESE
jgi:hypothetical protein